MSLRGSHRTSGVCYLTLEALAAEAAPRAAFVDPLLSGENGNGPKLDALGSFVPSRSRTRQLAAWTPGDRSQQSAAELRASLPPDYRCRRRLPGQNAPRRH